MSGAARQAEVVTGTAEIHVPVSRAKRVAVASLIATIAALFPLAEHVRVPTRPTDFGIVWFGARSLLHGIDPYPLVGPGRTYSWDWELYYPATSMVIAMPFAWLPEYIAAAAFVWISTALLAYAITEKSWDLLFLFPSSAFIVAARAAQWSPLFSAAFCLPWLGFVLAAKPNVGGAIALASASRKLLLMAALGALVLTGVSLMLLPSWPVGWMTALSNASHLSAPIARMGGFLVLLNLLRWKRPEARLILLLACVPQTGSWYEALPLLLVASTRRESQILSLVSSLGFLLIRFMIHGQPEVQFNREVSALMLAFAYLPATIAVLRRPNEGKPPAWLPRRYHGPRLAA
jgi:hypothetical protein